MTSNIGSQIISNLSDNVNVVNDKDVSNSIMDIVRNTISPELLNRIDETIIFNRLQREDMDKITDIHLNDISKRLDDNQNMTLNVSNNAKLVLSDHGYDIRYGARPLKRVLNRDILNPLSRLVLEGTVKDGDIVYVRTRAEAEEHQEKNNDNKNNYGWICSSPISDNKNDIVILRNHEYILNNYDDVDSDHEMTNIDNDTNDDEERLLDDPHEWPVHN